ncbi:MAG: hypothetical protein ACREMF_09190 [Gemmatimonadales bacterium]
MRRTLSTLVALGLLGCSREAKRDVVAREPGATTPSSGAPATPAAPRGICGYITEAEASDVLDQSSRYRRSNPSSQSCVIDPASVDAFRGVSVDFRVSRGNTAMYDFFAAQKSSEPLRGLGERALWLPAGRTRGNLVAVKGADAVSLTISDFSGRGDLKGRARAFAKKVLEHM